MFCKKVLAAAAVSAMATGVVGLGCDDETVTVQSTADAIQAAACREIEGNLVIDTPQNDEIAIDLSGQLSSVGGDFTVKNNRISSLSASSLQTIGGAFELTNLTALSELSMVALTEVKSISWTTLTNLGSFDFGNEGITKAESVTIGDTFLSSIEGINVEAPSNMNLNNNGRLTSFSSQMKSMEVELILQDNNQDLEVSLPQLAWAANLTISQISSISLPKLETINGSIRFSESTFQTFSAPKLTETSTGDISFVSCGQATNISFPVLEKIGGGFTIANNTELAEIDGFNALTQVGGGVAFRGSFTSVELPEINDVKGGFEIVSTETIGETCDHFQELSDNDTIQGKYNCDGQEDDANEDTSEAGNGNGGNGNGNGNNDDDDEDAASLLGLNMATVMAVVGLGVMFTTL